jgi:hypothetical protein
VLYSAAQVAGNVAAGGRTHLAQAVHAMPAVTMVLAWHLLSRFFASAYGRTGPNPVVSSQHPTTRTATLTKARNSNTLAIVCAGHLQQVGGQRFPLQRWGGIDRSRRRTGRT